MTVAQIIGEAFSCSWYVCKNTQKLTDYIGEVMEESGLLAKMMHRYPTPILVDKDNVLVSLVHLQLTQDLLLR